MAESMSRDEFASLTSCLPDDVDRYVGGGLLDPDGDELFDQFDLLRLDVIRRHLGEGKPLESLRDEIEVTSNDVLVALFAKTTGTHMPEDVAERVGMSVDHIRALGAAIGIAPGEPISAEDVTAIELTRTMLDAGFPFDALLEGTRIYADALRRVAESSLELTHRYLCEPLIRAGQDERELATQLGPALAVVAPTAETLLRHLHRTYMREAALAHAVTHLQQRDPDSPPGSSMATILFVDLALFSSLAELEGDEAAVSLIDRLDQSVRELSANHEGRVVKQIGDEFMLIFKDPAASVRFAMELRESTDRNEHYIALRTGIHHGTVIYRLGDYWGRAVNIASRIASMAQPNTILITEPVAKAAADDGIQVEEIGVRGLRGMEEPVPLYRVMN